MTAALDRFVGVRGSLAIDGKRDARPRRYSWLLRCERCGFTFMQNDRGAGNVLVVEHAERHDRDDAAQVEP